MKEIEDPWRQPSSSLSLCVFFFSFIPPLPHPVFLFLTLPLSICVNLPPSPSPFSQFTNQTYPSGGVLSLSLCPLPPGRKSTLNDPTYTMTVGSKLVASLDKLLSHSSLIFCSVIIFFGLPPSDTPNVAISASALHLLSYFVLSQSYTHTRAHTHKHTHFEFFTTLLDLFFLSGSSSVKG